MFDGLFNPVGGKRRVLFVAPPAGVQETWRSHLEAKGLRAEVMDCLQRACERLAVLRWDLVVVDIEGMPDAVESCLRLLRELRTTPPPSAPLIVMAGAAQLEAVSGLLSCGAADYLAKPFSPEHLLERVWVALAASRGLPEERIAETAARSPIPRREPAHETASSTGSPPSALPAGLIIGRGAAIQRVMEPVHLVAPKRTTVLITGETGTGKERVARAVHSLSRRQGRPMVSVNCGGIPAHLLEDEFFGHVKGAFTDAHQQRIGRFEQAHGSGIFLDEIGDLPLELQPKLLRVLQEREIHRIGGSDTIRTDARVIAATNVDLWSRVAEGTFREDLFYRINVFPIHLPPL
jgi:DNA-binding NtrC family response regulator